MKNSIYYGSVVFFRNGGVCYQFCDGRYHADSVSNGFFGTGNVSLLDSGIVQCRYVISSTNASVITWNLESGFFANCSVRAFVRHIQHLL